LAAENIRDELMSLRGVADADIDVDPEDGVPSGVRVHLETGADPSRVGAEVQRVLASHGMRSQVAGEELAPVVSLPVAAPASPMPEADAVSPPPSLADPGEPVATPIPPVSPDREVGDRHSLASLAYEESIDGVIVTAVAADGHRFSRRAADTTDTAVASAVAAAVGALIEGRPQRLLWMATETVEGSEVVTVVLEKSDGTRVAGAAVVRGAKAFAVARATSAALRG